MIARGDFGMISEKVCIGPGHWPTISCDLKAVFRGQLKQMFDKCLIKEKRANVICPSCCLFVVIRIISRFPSTAVFPLLRSDLDSDSFSSTSLELLLLVCSLPPFYLNENTTRPLKPKASKFLANRKLSLTSNLLCWPPSWSLWAAQSHTNRGVVRFSLAIYLFKAKRTISKLEKNPEVKKIES